MNISSSGIRIYKNAAKQMLPQTSQPQEDQKAWEHVVDQADSLPMTDRPEKTQYNSTVDEFESRWLTEHGEEVAFYPREQELAGFLHQISRASQKPRTTEVGSQTLSPDIPTPTRQSVLDLSKFDRKHQSMARRLAETSPLGSGIGSDKVYLADILRLKDKLTSADRTTLNEMQKTYFAWEANDTKAATVDEIYTNQESGVRVEMAGSKTVAFSEVDPRTGQAEGYRTATIGSLRFQVPQGSKVMLKGSASFTNEQPMILTDVESPDETGQAEFQPWFRFGGTVYKQAKQYPHQRYSGKLDTDFEFIVTAPPENDSDVPRVIDSGKLRLPSIHRAEGFKTEKMSD